MAARRRRTSRKRCRFCRDNVDVVDYKDTNQLQRLMSGEAAIFGKKRSGNCSRHQRMVKQAIKRARFLALLPYR
ncbi:MAG: 30S ribosomal protein S18 [Candidatus Brocadiia bacterium]